MPPTPPRAPRRRRADETSAGGLVIRTEDGISAAALIGRLDRRGRLRWSLPKGHVEQGETTEQAAIREVAEETGINGRITARLGSGEYTFPVRGKRSHQRVHHFLMEAVAGELSDADLEVTEVAWVPMNEIAQRLAYATYQREANPAAEPRDGLPKRLSGTYVPGRLTDFGFTMALAPNVTWTKSGRHGEFDLRARPVSPASLPATFRS